MLSVKPKVVLSPEETLIARDRVETISRHDGWITWSKAKMDIGLGLFSRLSAFFRIEI